MTTPAGTAPWTRAVGVADYGGHVEKTDYLNIGPVNPKTDISAAQWLRMVADVTAAVRTSPLLTVSFTCRDSGTPDDPLVTAVTGMRWNYSSVSGYDGGAPPTGYPTVTRQSDGCARVTLAASYTDDFSVAGAISIRHAAASANSASIVGAVATLISSFVVEIRIFTVSTGAALADGSATVEIW